MEWARPIDDWSHDERGDDLGGDSEPGYDYPVSPSKYAYSAAWRRPLTVCPRRGRLMRDGYWLLGEPGDETATLATLEECREFGIVG